MENTEEVNQLLLAADILYNNGWVGKARHIYRTAIDCGYKVDENKFQTIEQMYNRLPPQERDLPGHRQIAIRRDQVVSTLHFTSDLTPYERRVAFLSGVRVVEVETSSQCNRRCPYCPNSKFDRISHNTYIEDGIFNRIIDDLVRIGYCGRLHFHGYNEPLMYPENLEMRLKTARAKLPRAILGVYTNGDYLTADTLRMLVDCGVNHIRLSIHLGANKPWNEADIFQRVFNKAQELGLHAVLTKFVAGEFIQCLLVGANTEILMMEGNYMKSGSNRGELLQSVGPDMKDRTFPCINPFMYVIINHRGDVVPCCDFVGDAPEHQYCVVGNVAEASLFDLYTNEKYTRWRLGVLSTGTKPKPCNHCSPLSPEPPFDDESQANIDAAIAERMQQLAQTPAE